MRTGNNLLFARFFPRNISQKVLPAALAKKPAAKAEEFRKMDLGIMPNITSQLPKREKLDLTGYQYDPKRGMFYKIWDEEPEKTKDAKPQWKKFDLSGYTFDPKFGWSKTVVVSEKKTMQKKSSKHQEENVTTPTPSKP